MAYSIKKEKNTFYLDNCCSETEGYLSFLEVNSISDKFAFTNFSMSRAVPGEFCNFYNCAKRKSRFRHEGVEISKNITEKTPIEIQFSTGKLLCDFALRLTVMELETSENDKLGIVWDFSTEVLGFQLGIFGLT